MALKLAQFTAVTLQDTQNAWISSAENMGIPCIDYEKLLLWTASHIDYTVSGDSFAYGIFDEDTTEAVAIIDIVYSRRPGPDIGWLKMLSVNVGPLLSAWEVDANPSKIAQVIDIFAEAIVGTIDLTSDHKARVVKLYGRNDHLLSTLIAINERLRAIGTAKFSSKMEGRWLVITAHGGISP